MACRMSTALRTRSQRNVVESKEKSLFYGILYLTTTKHCKIVWGNISTVEYFDIIDRGRASFDGTNPGPMTFESRDILLLALATLMFPSAIRFHVHSRKWCTIDSKMKERVVALLIMRHFVHRLAPRLNRIIIEAA